MQAPNLVFLALEDVRLGVWRIHGWARGVRVGEPLSDTVHHRCCIGYGRVDGF